jgi:phosphoglycolate phosphatase
MNPDLVIFDLDGTLLNSLHDIHRCVQMALEECGLDGVSLERIATFHGAPLHEFHAALAPPASLDTFVTVYRALQDRHGLDTTRPYDGVPEMLAALADLPLAVASTKPTGRVVEHTNRMGLADHFDHLRGTDQPPYKPDPAVLLRVLRRFPDADPARSWMVGDLPSDMAAGVAAGMRTLGVTFSGISADELRAGGAERVVDVPGEILAAIRGPIGP